MRYLSASFNGLFECQDVNLSVTDDFWECMFVVCYILLQRNTYNMSIYFSKMHLISYKSNGHRMVCKCIYKSSLPNTDME